jgi:hypothetical protein
MPGNVTRGMQGVGKDASKYMKMLARAYAEYPMEDFDRTTHGVGAGLIRLSGVTQSHVDANPIRRDKTGAFKNCAIPKTREEYLGDFAGACAEFYNDKAFSEPNQQDEKEHSFRARAFQFWHKLTSEEGASWKDFFDTFLQGKRGALIIFVFALLRSCLGKSEGSSKPFLSCSYLMHRLDAPLFCEINILKQDTDFRLRLRTESQDKTSSEPGKKIATVRPTHLEEDPTW